MSLTLGAVVDGVNLVPGADKLAQLLEEVDLVVCSAGREHVGGASNRHYCERL